MQKTLAKERYVVETADTFHEASLKIADYSYDCILLDIMLPDGNGLRLLEHIKELRKRENVIIISARNSLEDKVLGLEQGADDYLPKPFEPRELLARVKALLRRYCIYQGKAPAEPHHPKPDDQMLELHGVRIALDCNRVWVDEQEADLTETEYKILKLLMQSPQRIFPVQVIYETVWGEPYFYVSNGTVMVHIRNLRMKVEHNPQNPQRICTVWGKGYRFAAQEDGNGNT